MTFLFVIICVFLVLMFTPILIGRYSQNFSQNRPLYVRSENRKDPRYFAKSFTALMNGALKTYDGSGTIALSRPERLLTTGRIAGPQSPCEAVVYAPEALCVEPGCVVKKEIYAGQSAVVEERAQVRAIACKTRLLLKEGVVIDRWADANRRLEAEAGCSLGISATSGYELLIGRDCRFKRLYGSEIRIGGGYGLEKMHLADVYYNRFTQIVYRLGGDTVLDAGERAENAFVTRENFCAGERCVIFGSVRAGKNVRLRRNTVVTGNVFADGDIVLEEGVQVYGDVFSQESVYIGGDCGIGRRGHIKSVVARARIVVSEHATIYGYMAAEQAGTVVARERYHAAISEKY